MTVHDLSGTDVTQVSVDLAGTPGGTAGDGAADNVTVEGTAGDDVIQVQGDAALTLVTGLAAQVDANVVIDFGHGDKVTLTNTSIASLVADDFVTKTPAAG